MNELSRRISLSLVVLSTLAFVPIGGALAQQNPVFTPGNLVVTVEGCGNHGGTCTSVPNGTGTGAGNSSAGGYGDNQAAPLTLFQYAPSGTASVTFVNSLVLPQSGANANFPVSGEYGSSSEGTLQLSGAGQYLTLMGYGIDAPTFDAAYAPGFTTDPYGAAPSGSLAQSGSLTGKSYAPVPRVVSLVDPYGNVNSATALYNVFDTNNPRSVYTEDGVTAAYVSGQGTGCDLTGGVFYTPLGAPNTAPVAITGADAVPTATCVASGYTGSLVAQDTRTVQIYDGALFISVDSTEGKSDNRSFVGFLGLPPATSSYTPAPLPPNVWPSVIVPNNDAFGSEEVGPAELKGFGNTGGTGKVTITTGANTNGNSLNNSTTKVNSVALDLINLSPSNYFFASPSVLYVADTGNPKNDSNGDNNSSGSTNIGDGGLQKWVNSSPAGTGTWSLAYTLYQGLNLVNNGGTSGTTGLYGLTGVVSGGTAFLYATNATINDFDTTYLYGITDTLSTTTNPGTTFTLLDTAPQDSNFKGVSLAPSLPAGSATITSSPSGLAVSTAGAGCVTGTYTTPVTLIWTPGSNCTLSVASPQGSNGTQYTLAQWQDGSAADMDSVTAPSTAAVYTATFSTAYELTTAAGTGGSVSAGGFIPAGTSAEVSATPDAGYYFVNFTGSTTSTDNPLTLTMNGPQSITANFAPQVTPTVTWPAASAITYGQTLAQSTLSGGSAMSGGNAVQGSFAFASPGTAPTAGTQLESVTFTPANPEFTPVSSTVSVQVNQATPTVTWPAASTLTYGQTLASSALSGGSAISPITSANVTGSFAFTMPATVPVAGTQSESVTFTPSDSIDYSSVNSTVLVTVNKAPTSVSVLPTASAITFGQSLAASTLTGGAAVSTITGATVPGTFAFASPATLPSATGPQSVIFTPADTSDYIGVGTSVTVQVTPVPLASVAPASIDFGTLYLGSIVTKTVTVTNTGDAVMTIHDPLIAILRGGDSSEFLTVNLCPPSLAAGKSCIMTVTFFAGPFYNPQTAILTINDNAAGSPQTVPLTATVIDPEAQFSPASLSFGPVRENSGQSTKSITLISSGGTALEVTNVAIAGADPGDFTETNNCITTLAPRTTCSINVTFNPTTKGQRTGNVVVTSNTHAGTQSIPLSGNGN